MSMPSSVSGSPTRSPVCKPHIELHSLTSSLSEEQAAPVAWFPKSASSSSSSAYVGPDGASDKVDPKVTKLFSELNALPLSEKFLILFEIHEKSGTPTNEISIELKEKINAALTNKYEYRSSQSDILKDTWSHLIHYMCKSNAHRTLYQFIYNTCLKRTKPEDVNTWFGHTHSNAGMILVLSAFTLGSFPLVVLAPQLPSYAMDKISRKTLSVCAIYQVLQKMQQLKGSHLSANDIKIVVQDIISQYELGNEGALSRESSHSGTLIKTLKKWSAEIDSVPVQTQPEKINQLWLELKDYLQVKRAAIKDDFLGTDVRSTEFILRARQNNGKKLFLVICDVVDKSHAKLFHRGEV